MEDASSKKIPAMKPFLKWVGGKTQILEEVMKQFPETIQDYYEPFLGGGSILLEVLERKIVKGNIYASDLNGHLIDLYVAVQTDVEGLIASVKKLMEVPSTEEYYYQIRDSFNQTPSSAKFLYLNKTCFRGVYREGPRGFNVPYGHYKNPGILDEDHLRAVSALIQPVVFSVTSFEDVLSQAKEGDFVYLDPPYVPLNATSFVGYKAGGFSKHAELFELCKTLPNFLLSNADVPLVREAFQGYEIKTISARRAIHSKKPESRTNEVLIRKLQTSS